MWFHVSLLTVFCEWRTAAADQSATRQQCETAMIGCSWQPKQSKIEGRKTQTVCWKKFKLSMWRKLQSWLTISRHLCQYKWPCSHYTFNTLLKIFISTPVIKRGVIMSWIINNVCLNEFVTGTNESWGLKGEYSEGLLILLLLSHTNKSRRQVKAHETCFSLAGPLKQSVK